jgi:organic radical activating enzyme
MSDLPHLRDLYRLPYSKNDNPNAWVEITTVCNMRCPGCYKGCNIPGNEGVHEPVDTVMEVIREMLRLRNCSQVLLSGGEPLMHPQIIEIVSKIKEMGLYPFIHSNGTLLTEELLRSLKNAGLTGILIRTDSLMYEGERQSEKELNAKRDKYADIIRKIGGINTGFVCVVDQHNLPEVPVVFDWFRDHCGTVDYMTFIVKRETALNELYDKHVDMIDLKSLVSALRDRVPVSAYCSYLGSQKEDAELKWLQSLWLAGPREIIGFTGPHFMELLQAGLHFFRGKYSYIFRPGHNRITSLEILMLSLPLKAFRKILRHIIFNKPSLLFAKKHVQCLAMVCPPQLGESHINLCDGCPDAVLFEGKLYPSCALEVIKQRGTSLLHKFEV